MIQNVTSIQVTFVIPVLARFEILDHCIYLSTRLPWVPEGGFYFRDEATIVSSKATIEVVVNEKTSGVEQCT